MVEGFENNYGSRAVLWRNMTRITIFFENSAACLLPNGQRFEDRFPFFFPLQELVSVALTLQLFHFTWCIDTSGWTVRGPDFLLR